eukprot:11191057-Prorocentrum_lima.AAC.1
MWIYVRTKPDISRVVARVSRAIRQGEIAEEVDAQCTATRPHQKQSRLTRQMQHQRKQTWRSGNR